MPSHVNEADAESSPLFENTSAVSARSAITSSLPVAILTLPEPLAASSKLPLESVDVIVFASILILSTFISPNTAVPSVPETTSDAIVASE